jgi:hypothetical protein
MVTELASFGLSTVPVQPISSIATTAEATNRIVSGLTAAVAQVVLNDVRSCGAVPRMHPRTRARRCGRTGSELQR